MAKTAAERQRRRREKLKADDQTYEQYKVRNAQFSRVHREKKKATIKTLTGEEQSEIAESRREKDRARQRKCRRRKQEKDLLRKTVSGTVAVAVAAYSAKHSLNRAVNRVKRMLPGSPRKRSTVIRKLADEIGLQVKEVQQKKTRMDGIPPTVTESVKQFYQRDDISRMCPGKRDVITVNGEQGKQKMQKRHMSMNIKEAYAFFKDENRYVKIGLSKFAELRPPNVLLCSQMPSNVCTCVYHENFFMAVDALHAVVPAVPLYTTALPSSCLLCPDNDACWFSECDHAGCGFQFKYQLPDDGSLVSKEVRWKKWEESSGRLVKGEETGTVKELYDYVCSLAPKFLRHCRIKRLQAQQYEADKVAANLADSHMAVLQMDFSENYTCIAQDEIQSAHWNQMQLTLYTSVSWFRGMTMPHVVVSNTCNTTRLAAVVFTDQLLSAMPNGIQEVRVWTDGPASQFKNRFIVAAMDLLSQRHNIQIRWNYFATSHGKGPVDGVGGTLKRVAADKVRTRQCTINSMEDFIAAVQHSSIRVTGVNADSVATREGDLNLEQVFQQANVIKGIADYHCLEQQDAAVLTKRYSSELLNPSQTVEPSGEVAAGSNGESSSNHIVPEVGQWYAVYWRATDYWFVGRILRKSKSTVTLEFIHQTSQDVNSFKTVNDTDSVPISDILLQVQAPTPVSSSRCSSFHLNDSDFQRVTSAFKDFCR